MEPSQRSPGSGDGIRTETPPRTPPGPPRSERGRKRKAGGDPELPQLPRGAKRPKDGDGGAWHSTTPPSDGDRLFAQKCPPMVSPNSPHGMGGSHPAGLSSFQQSVAMDRIQRIIGVLQKPEMGARYLGTLLQVEVMLKVWFPHVAPKAGPDPDPVGVLLLLRDRHSAHGDGATSGTSGGTSGTTSGVTTETTPTGTTHPKLSPGSSPCLLVLLSSLNLDPIWGPDINPESCVPWGRCPLDPMPPPVCSSAPPRCCCHPGVLCHPWTLSPAVSIPTWTIIPPGPVPISPIGSPIPSLGSVSLSHSCSLP
uniref:Uncharacterized protein n=1 Tax=Coturnix japonica TaxID=93934 RepID=A0A8C2TWB7_COTJA